jgi:hypothetical protein
VDLEKLQNQSTYINNLGRDPVELSNDIQTLKKSLKFLFNEESRSELETYIDALIV